MVQGVTRILNHLGDLFEERRPPSPGGLRVKVDHKLRRKIQGVDNTSTTQQKIDRAGIIQVIELPNKRNRSAAFLCSMIGLRVKVDHKLRRKIQEKKAAQGHKRDDHEPIMTQ